MKKLILVIAVIAICVFSIRHGLKKAIANVKKDCVSQQTQPDTLKNNQ